MTYTISGLAELAGVSVRTLHHYDEIGLLAPGGRNSSGYRVYGEGELLRLQQILLYRELEFPLDEIREILDRPDRDALEALRGHRRSIEERAARLRVLLATIDKTIARVGGEESMLSDEELYEGFDPKDVAEMKVEAEERWGAGEAYKESRKRVGRMTKEQWKGVREGGEAMERACAAAFLAGTAPDSAEALGLMARKAEHLRSFYEPSPEIFAGLGEMYAADDRFRATYDKYAIGLADWLKLAMAAFAKRGMRA